MAKATKLNAKKNLYKQQIAEEKDKADKVQSPPPDDAISANRLASELAKLVGRKSAFASFKSAPRRPKPFTGEGVQNSAGAVRRFTESLALFFALSNIKPKMWAANARLFLEGSAFDYRSTCKLL